MGKPYIRTASPLEAGQGPSPVTSSDTLRQEAIVHGTQIRVRFALENQCGAARLSGGWQNFPVFSYDMRRQLLYRVILSGKRGERKATIDSRCDLVLSYALPLDRSQGLVSPT